MSLIPSSQLNLSTPNASFANEENLTGIYAGGIRPISYRRKKRTNRIKGSGRKRSGKKRSGRKSRPCKCGPKCKSCGKYNCKKGRSCKCHPGCGKRRRTRRK